MSPAVTQTWKGKTRSRTANQGDTALMVFDVVGATDEDDAMDMLAASSFAIEVGAAFDSTDLDDPLRCMSIVPARRGNTLITLNATFQCPPTGFFRPTINPTLLPAKYHWQTCVEDDPFDREIAGNHPVLNSTYQAPSNPPRRTIIKKILTITKTYGFYDQGLWKGFENAVNSDTILLFEPGGNVNTYAPGTMKCVSIEPGEAYTVDDVFVPIVKTVELYDMSQFNTNITEPFQLHILDQGTFGYNSAGDLLQLQDKFGNLVTQDQPLNGLGKPIDTTLRLSDGSTPVNGPNGTPAGATVESVGSGSFATKFLKYTRYAKVPLLPLFIE